ncbi:MAG: hypothetical protein LC732_05045, partial [Acidobacteria bacterium]|nr:hypothetical protein [Acidobacteriota bacterium]
MRMPPTAAIFVFIFAAAAANGQALFPQPLHLTREIADPVTGRTTLVEEYFSGNRAVSIAGDLTAVVDYAKGESVRIDRSQATFSVT